MKRYVGTVGIFLILALLVTAGSAVVWFARHANGQGNDHVQWKDGRAASWTVERKRPGESKVTVAKAWYKAPDKLRVETDHEIVVNNGNARSTYEKLTGKHSAIVLEEGQRRPVSDGEKMLNGDRLASYWNSESTVAEQTSRGMIKDQGRDYEIVEVRVIPRRVDDTPNGSLGMTVTARVDPDTRLVSSMTFVLHDLKTNAELLIDTMTFEYDIEAPDSLFVLNPPSDEK